MQQVTPQELKNWLDNNSDFILVDVREEWEREMFHIGGISIPMGVLIGEKDNIPKDKKVVLYCEKGIRSVIAIQRLETYGYNNLYNLAGGMYAWKAAGLQ